MAHVDSLSLTTSDGHLLDADLARPDDPIGGAVVCHPHPQHGGDRFHPIVDALFLALAERDVLTLRFDFRAEHDSGSAEQLDVVAALDELGRHVDLPLVAAGYSFGAAVVLATRDARITVVAAVAPPLGLMEVPAPDRPTLLLVPRHDQFSPPANVEAATADWDDTVVETVESADHFLVGRAREVAERAASWLVPRLERR